MVIISRAKMMIIIGCAACNNRQGAGSLMFALCTFMIGALPEFLISRNFGLFMFHNKYGGLRGLFSYIILLYI